MMEADTYIGIGDIFTKVIITLWNFIIQIIPNLFRKFQMTIDGLYIGIQMLKSAMMGLLRILFSEILIHAKWQSLYVESIRMDNCIIMNKEKGVQK